MCKFSLLAIALPAMLSMAALARGQNPEPVAAANVSGLQGVVHTVADVDRSAAYYRDTLGLEVTAVPKGFRAEPDAARATGTEGLKVRRATVKFPGASFDLELAEYQGVKRMPGQWAVRTPGNVNLNLRVRDIDATMAAVTKAGATALTPGGKPLLRNG